MNKRSLRLQESRLIEKHGRREQKVFSVPKIGEVIVVNEYPMRYRDYYIKCDEGYELEKAISERFIGRVKVVTQQVVIIEIKTHQGIKERAISARDFELEFYRYVVVNNSCWDNVWTYDELSFESKAIKEEIISTQVFLGIRKLG